MSKKDKDTYENENNNIDEMFKVATEKVDETSKDTSKKTNKKVVYGIVGGMVGFITLLIGASFFINPQDFINQTKNPDWVEKKNEQEEINDSRGQWDFDYPADVPEWTKHPFKVENSIEELEIYEDMLDFADDTQNLKMYLETMNSAEGGDWEDAPKAYTNKTWEQELEDGSENPQYSYTLKEDYMIAYSSYLQRLINPVFGDWVFAQMYQSAEPMKDNDDLDVLSDMFTDRWWDENISHDDYSRLPILADWEGDHFGELEFADKEPGEFGTFYGVVDDEKDVEVEMNGYDNNDQPIIRISVPVEYFAFGKDEDKLTKKGKLEITLVSNDNISDLNNRVVIDEATLSLD